MRISSNGVGGVTVKVSVSLVGTEIGFNDGDDVIEAEVGSTRCGLKLASPVVLSEDGLDLRLGGVKKDILLLKRLEKDINDGQFLGKREEKKSLGNGLTKIGENVSFLGRARKEVLFNEILEGDEEIV